MRATILAAVCAAFCATAAISEEPIRLVEEFSLSPDGKTLYFAWRGDLWAADSSGGAARRITAHAAAERFPRVSPDGETLAFVSDRTGANQVFLMPAAGGMPRQVTFHSEGAVVSDWFPDGKAILIKGSRDHFWRDSQRYFLKRLDESAPLLLFDGSGHSAQVSPDGRSLLFIREGVQWWRKGYVGPQASQLWTFDTASRAFRRLSKGDRGEQWPTWHPDGRRYYFVAQPDGTRNLFRRDLDGTPAEPLTSYKDDDVLMPTLSRDGSTLVFRRGSDLYRLSTVPGSEPARIDLVHAADRIHPRTLREQLTAATQVAFADDAREIAFIAGGDLWVMDSELREPRRITNTPGEERDPVFAPDFGSILYVSEDGGQCDIYQATRKDPKRFWWQNEEFETKRLTNDARPEFDPQFLPNGRVAFTRLRGDLWTMLPDGEDRSLVFLSWAQPGYSFSPDGEWVAYATDDNDFNRDVWIRRTDGTGEAVNITRHPDWEGDPVWSPDGKMLAFVGRRNHDETDIHYVYLRKEDHDRSSRDRTLEKAEKKMKGRKVPSPEKPKPAVKGAKKPAAKTAFERMIEALRGPAARPKPKAAAKKPAATPKQPMTIDFEGIEDRIRRVPLLQVAERDLFWSHDSKRLAFTAKIDGKEGIYTISPPDDLRPKLLSTARGSGWRWLKEGNQIVGLASSRPTSISSRGSATSFPFRVRVETDLAKRNEAIFDLCWRSMRDNWYDPHLNNRDWKAVGEKYRAMARECLTGDEITQVVRMMLGELNGSHLGFSARMPSTFRPPVWSETTPHFGVRFDPAFEGPGLRVADVIKGSPARRKKSRIYEDEVIVSIDGREIDPKRDLALQINGEPNRDVRLEVRDFKDRVRTVVIRPTTYRAVRGLLYDHWTEKNRSVVDKQSDGRLGYLHVRGMNWSSFERFEAELYKVGHGKDGLVIDVRDNGGGFTADHLLTCLCQPVHAITVPRGGGKGYPQGRMVYARWDKPIIVLCNQNSFSNAEIFSHAIRSLKRGRIVGVQTAGGVISTGGRSIMGLGFLRMPFRGWFVAKTGEDMELNGCKPDVVIWPEPEEWTRGKDRQLSTAIEMLIEDVARDAARARPPIRYRTEEEPR